MKNLHVKDYDISIREEPPYSFRSADNKYYDKVHCLVEQDYEYAPKTVCVRVEKDCFVKEAALIVSYHALIENCTLPAGDCVFLMLDNILCLLCPDTLELVKKAVINPVGAMFAAYAYETDFILYGEVEIYRIAQDLMVLWTFSGRDIFVRYMGEEPAFEMRSDRICLYDFEDNYYEIDYDGKVINDGAT